VTSESITLAGGGSEAEALDGLVERARAGDEAAFEEILARFEGKALAIARNMGASREDAEDIAQEGFLKLFRHIEAYRGGRRFTSWFYRIIINVARDHLQQSAARRGASGPAGGEREMESYPSEDPAASHDLEVRERTRDALQRLSLREREVVILKDVQGLSVWEISRILRLDPITVRRHAMRARARLREILGRS
jgi:RNA polymerase sigma-70 factor (ECF subfamily)